MSACAGVDLNTRVAVLSWIDTWRADTREAPLRLPWPWADLLKRPLETPKLPVLQPDY